MLKVHKPGEGKVVEIFHTPFSAGRCAIVFH